MVLIIDDERSVRTVMQMALQAAGLKVLTASSGQEGLRILELRHREISLVLLDVGMPGMGGDEVLRSLRASGIDVNVAICSGYSEVEVIETFKDLSVKAFLRKPFRMDYLTKRVRELID